MTAVEDIALACRIFTSHSLDYFLQRSGLYTAENGGAGLARSEDDLTAAFQLQVVQDCPVCPLSDCYQSKMLVWISFKKCVHYEARFHVGDLISFPPNQDLGFLTKMLASQTRLCAPTTCLFNYL